MSVLIALAALALLMLAAYRGYSVILFAPIAALGAVLLTDPGAVGPTFTGLFMEKMVGFVKLYFPVFLLGAVFGKLIELSGFSRSIVAAAIQILGRRHAIPVIVLVCALLTYGGVSLFVVAFAVYPFAAELFRQSGIPKRLIPASTVTLMASFNSGLGMAASPLDNTRKPGRAAMTAPNPYSDAVFIAARMAPLTAVRLPSARRPRILRKPKISTSTIPEISAASTAQMAVILPTSVTMGFARPGRVSSWVVPYQPGIQRVNSRFSMPTTSSGEIAISGCGRLMLSGVSGSFFRSVP